MSKKKIPLEPNKIYHVYNHAISNELLFRNDNNFEYFFKKYKEYIVPIADTFAYCLMPNHFHFSLKIKSEKELIKYYVQDRKLPESTNYKNFDDEKELLRLNSQQFGNFLNAYAKAYNKMYKRKGKLYWSEFERKLVDSDSYFRRLIHYIHFNPVFHGFVKDLRVHLLKVSFLILLQN